MKRSLLIIIVVGSFLSLVTAGTVLAQAVSPQADQYVAVEAAAAGPTAAAPMAAAAPVTEAKGPIPTAGVAIALLAGSGIVGLGASYQLLKRKRR